MHSSEAHWSTAHRNLRLLPEGEGPFRGVLVTNADENLVAVPVPELGDWAGWGYAGCEHIAAPRDIALLDQGFCALLPWCVHEVTGFLAGARLGGDPLSGGEVCTLAVSLLRGLAELGEGLGSVAGRWWLQHDGRPLLVVGEGEDAVISTREIISELADCVPDRPLARLLIQLAAAAERPRSLVREIERWEGELLECAAPQPIRVQRQNALGRAPFVRTEFVRERPIREAGPAVASRLPAGEFVWEQIDRVRTLLRAVLRRGRDQLERRPRRALVAVAAAAIVLLGGFFWPTAAKEQAPAERFPPIAAAEPPVSLSQPVASETVFDSIGPASERAVLALAEQARECLAEQDAGCSAVLAPEATAELGELLEIIESATAVTLLDDYGDIAVLRVQSIETSHLLVIVRHDRLWRVRDIHYKVNAG